MLKKYKNDIIIISIIIIIAVVTLIAVNLLKKPGNSVVVTIDGEFYEAYDLNEDIEVELDTGNTLVIKDNQAYVSTSTCKDKVCVNHGRISSVGETIICLPHKLVIEIRGSEQNE